MSNYATIADHEEFRMQLPWYVNGTLTKSEASEIREHLEDCPECRADLAVHEEIHAAAKYDDAIPIVPTISANDLLDRFESRQTLPVRWQRKRFAAVAAIAAAALVTIYSYRVELGIGEQSPRYQTATSEKSEAAISYVLQLTFEDEVSSEGRQHVIQELGGAEVRLMEDSEVYEVLLHLPESSLEDLERYADEAQSRKEVKSAEFVALQLPVR